MASRTAEELILQKFNNVKPALVLFPSDVATGTAQGGRRTAELKRQHFSQHICAL